MSQTISGNYTGGVTLSGNPATITRTAVISGTTANTIGVYAPAGTDWTLANAGVGLSSFHDLDSKVPAATKTELDQLKADIISGTKYFWPSKVASATPAGFSVLSQPYFS